MQFFSQLWSIIVNTFSVFGSSVSIFVGLVLGALAVLFVWKVVS